VARGITRHGQIIARSSSQGWSDGTNSGGSTDGLWGGFSIAGRGVLVRPYQVIWVALLTPVLTRRCVRARQLGLRLLDTRPSQQAILKTVAQAVWHTGRSGQTVSMVNPAACRRPGSTEPMPVAGVSTPARSGNFSPSSAKAKALSPNITAVAL
jgi:hypothetical protein